MSPEEEFRERLQAFGRDARGAARYAYTGTTIHYVAGSDQNLFDHLNKFAGFWNVVLGGLQASAVVALGRIYDATSKTWSAGKLLKHAETNPGIFSRAALARRKVPSLSATQAEEFVSSAFAPTAKDFHQLLSAFDKHAEIYDKTVAPIRHNAFAHTGPIKIQEVYELFSKISRDDFQRLIVFPLQLHSALWGLYENGIRPEINEEPMRVEELISNPFGRQTTSSEHRHAVKDTQEFLIWLQSKGINE
jgi:hypothetical protein